MHFISKILFHTYFHYIIASNATQHYDRNRLFFVNKRKKEHSVKIQSFRRTVKIELCKKMNDKIIAWKQDTRDNHISHIGCSCFGQDSATQCSINQGLLIRSRSKEMAICVACAECTLSAVDCISTCHVKITE